MFVVLVWGDRALTFATGQHDQSWYPSEDY